MSTPAYDKGLKKAGATTRKLSSVPPALLEEERQRLQMSNKEREDLEMALRYANNVYQNNSYITSPNTTTYTKPPQVNDLSAFLPYVQQMAHAMQVMVNAMNTMASNSAATAAQLTVISRQLNDLQKAMQAPSIEDMLAPSIGATYQ